MTKHCELRIKERMNLSKAAAEKLVFNAFHYGRNPLDLPSKEKAYMLSKESDGVLVRYYGGCCFIFSDTLQCITMYHAPEWFFRKSNYNGKTQIKNPKKYFTKHYVDNDYISEGWRNFQ